MTYEDLGRQIGALVDRKNSAYGNSHSDVEGFFRLLYPRGIRPEQYATITTLARMFDKMKRIATDATAFNEDPWDDLVGYSLLGARQVRKLPVDDASNRDPNHDPEKCEVCSTLNTLPSKPSDNDAMTYSAFSEALVALNVHK